MIAHTRQAANVDRPMSGFTLIGPDGAPTRSAVPGTLGGHRRSKVYGRLDCPGALRWIAKGRYVAHRVFFADEATALAAGYRPCARCLRARHREWKAGRMTVRIPMPQPFDADHLLGFLAARAVDRFEWVQDGAFHRATGETLRIAPGGVEVDAPAPSIRRLRQVVGADQDPRAVVAALGSDPLLGPLVRARPGLRAPGAFDDHEIAVRAIVGQAISVAAARTILGRLPDRDTLARARPEDLPMPRTRAAALIELARGRPLEEIRGVGPWTRGYVALRTGDPDVLLAGDLGVRRALARLGGPADPREIARLGGRWRPFRSYATHHLWAA